MNPPRDRPSASVSWVPFLCRLHNDVLGPRYYRSCRRCHRGLPFLRTFRASHRTLRFRPTVGSAGTRCSTCHVHRGGGATEHPSAPSTSYLQNIAGCLATDDTLGLARMATAGRSVTILHPTLQSAPQLCLPKDSLESARESLAKLCPRNLIYSINSYNLRQQDLHCRKL